MPRLTMKTAQSVKRRATDRALWDDDLPGFGLPRASLGRALLGRPSTSSRAATAGTD